MTDDKDKNNQTFGDAVLDMGNLFVTMKKKGIPHTVTLDIVRLQMMYSQQNAQQVRVPESAPDVVKAVEAAEEAGEIDA